VLVMVGSSGWGFCKPSASAAIGGCSVRLRK